MRSISRRHIFILLLALQLLAVTAHAAPVLGIDRPEHYLGKLGNLRVGLVVNQASVSATGAHAIDFLLARKVNLVKLFALEHGIRGGGGAGEEIPDDRDEATGLPITSLYGKNRKPTPAMLADVDVIIYDVQDVGVRFYTYISSLGLIMEAAAENGKTVFVFDRPNPNGDYIGGPLMKKGNFSFVGAFPIPLVYGMTAGELARMIHGRKWKKTDGLKLEVIALADYRRKDLFEPPVWPSPGLRSLKAIRMYPSMALLEPTVMSFGAGTPYSYLQYGHPDKRAGDHTYVPVPMNPKQKPRHEGKLCYGEKFYDLTIEQIPHFTTDVFVGAMKKLDLPGFVTERRFLDLLMGDSEITARMLAGEPYSSLAKKIAPELRAFERERAPFLLYK